MILSFPTNNTPSFNTGQSGTGLEMGKPVALIFHPANDFLEAADIADIKDTLQGKLYNPNPSARWQMIGSIGEGEDKTSDARTQDWGYGFVKTLVDGQHALMFNMLNGDLITHQIMRRFNRQHRRFRLLVVDDIEQLNGYRFNHSDNEEKFRGYTLANIYTPVRKTNVGEPPKYGMEVTLASSEEYNEKFFPIHMGFDALSDLRSVIDVEAQIMSALSSGIVDVLLTTNNRQDNLIVDIPTIVASGNFDVIRESNGAPVTITSVSTQIVGGTKVARFTMPTSGAGGLPTPGTDAILLSLKPVNTLITAGFDGLETPIKLRIPV